MGTFLVVPINKDSSILGSILGSPYLEKKHLEKQLYWESSLPPQ